MAVTTKFSFTIGFSFMRGFMFGHKKSSKSDTVVHTSEHVERIPASELNVVLLVKEAASPQIQQITKEVQDMESKIKKLSQEKQILEELLAVVTKQR
jgi:TolA-binding protein